MPTPRGASGTRVAVLGLPAAAGEWPPLMALKDVELTRAGSLQELFDAEPDLALVFASAGEASRVVEAFAGRAAAPPLTLLVEPAGRPSHPEARLIEALIRGKREWEGTFDALADPLAILGPDGVVVRANVSFARSLGIPVERVVAHHYLSLLGPPDPEPGDPIEASLGDGTARAGEARYDALPGRRLVETYPILGPAGRLQQLVVVLKDLTQVREQQARILDSAHLAAIGRLAGGVAHEINTPLASIALRAERLRRSAQAPELQALPAFRDFQRHLEAIEADVFRCKGIIGALLDFSRSRRPETRELDLNGLAARAVELVGYQARLKGVELALRGAPELPLVRGDEGQLRQVVVGLLMNALDAVGPGGHVAVETARPAAGGVALTVSDDGVGIPPEHRDKIFTPFFTTKPVGSGTGLGLAVCHGIVSAHGGEIQLRSEVGRGSRVEVRLPAAPRATGE